MISVKHDVLDEESLYRLQQTLYSDRFMWIEAQINKESTNSYYVHEFRDVNGIVSPYDFLIHPLLNILQPKAIIRVKANKYLQTPTLEEHEYHQDYPYKHKAAIFYINTNNGQTQFTTTRVASIENSMLYLDASTQHRSTSTTDAPYRININFNYF
tara:strand:- start:1179 stop:1646 length:468 start_codon:yes stop_codon:yes gene_type:complete